MTIQVVIEGLAVVGAISILIIVGTGGSILFESVKDKIESVVTRYKIKNRYKKKPTAKSYCRDCEKFNPETGECYDHCNSRRRSSIWYCCFSIPLTGNKLKEREKIMKELEDN